MESITSRKNAIIVQFRELAARRKEREAAGLFVCDGVKLLREALLWHAEIVTVLWAEEPSVDVPGAMQYRVPQDLLDYVTPLKSAAGVVFSVRIKPWPRQAPGRTLVLETLQDPGNLGTILRTANALSMDTVILTGDCADVYQPKAVRASMGAIFRQRFYQMERGDLRSYLDEYGMKLFGAALSERASDIRSVSLQDTAIAIGSEGQGLSEEFLSLCDGELIIPMNTQCESLNAGVAAAIVMWELTR